MVKPSKKDQSNKVSVQNGDGHSSINNTPRSLRSNAAVSQIFIASTASSTSASNLPGPVTMPTLPYSSSRQPKLNRDQTSLGLNSLHRGLDPLKIPMLTGASLLRQDFFLRGGAAEQSEVDSDKRQNGDSSSFDKEHNSQTNSNSPQVSNDSSSLSPLIELHPQSVPSTVSVATNVNERNLRQADVSGAEGDIRSSDKYSVRKPILKTNNEESPPTRDLLSNLRSLIFDENEGNKTLQSETDSNNHDSVNCSNKDSTRGEDLLDLNNSPLRVDNNASVSSSLDALLHYNSNQVQKSPEPSMNLTLLEPILETSRINDKSSTPSGTSYIKVSPDGAIQEMDRRSPQPIPSTSKGISTQQHHSGSPAKKTNSRSGRRARRLAAHDKRFATVSKLPMISSALSNPQQQLQDINVDLPPNWEARLDVHGRVFYIDHERRTTTWHRPPSTVNLGNSIMRIKVPQSLITEIEVGGRTIGSNSSSRDNEMQSTASNVRTEDSTEQQRVLLNRRYTLRRTISTRRPSMSFEESTDARNSTEDTLLIDPVATKSALGDNAGAITNQDTIDGNCLSSSSTNRARSYNSCMEQSLQQQSSSTSNPSSSQTQVNDPAITPSEVQSSQLPASSANPSQQTSDDPISSLWSLLDTHNRNMCPSVSCLNGLTFLNRSDFFNLLHLNDEALMLYNTSTNLKYIINKVRKDSTYSSYERFQHNKDLVAFLNKFSLKDEPLPVGWEVKVDEQGKCFYIDHVRKATTYVDPRLPTEIPFIYPRRLPLHGHRTPLSVATPAHWCDDIIEDVTVDPQISRPGRSSEQNPATSASSVSPSNPTISQDPAGVTVPSESIAATSQMSSISYEEKIVAFFKQSNIFDLIKSKRSAAALLNSSLRDRINQIRKGGVNVLKKYSHDVNLMMIISLFDVEVDAMSTSASSRSVPIPQIRSSVGRIIVPGKRDFEEKLRYFYKKLEQKNFGQGPNKLKLGIRRDHILEDAFTKVMSVNTKKELQRSRLYVSFAGEEGLDYGGPSREFFFLLSRELFNPYYGLFEYSANDTYTVQISPMSRFVDNYHDWFRFSGRMLGLALIHQYLLDAFFTRPFYKALLGLPCSLSDLEYLDAEFHQSLQWVKDTDISDLDLDLTFSVVEEVAGKVVEKELKSNGKNVAVTEKNKREYIKEMVKWRLERGVSDQTESLVKGFNEVSDG